jgi:hypothetical protein
MGTCTSTAGTEAEGYSEIRSGMCEKCHIPFEVIEQPDEIPDIRQCPKCGGNVGELLVAFASKDAKSYWGNEYQKERIIYAMRHRRDKIPMYLRTGKRTLRLRIFGLRFAATRLHKINQKEVT